MIKAEELKEYGKVEKCEEVNDTFHVIITEGFSDNMIKTIDCINKINSSVGEKYPMVKKLVTDTDNFEYIAEPKNYR